MTGELLWNKTINDLNLKEQEIQTGTGLWFSALSENDVLYIDRATMNKPSCNLSTARTISQKDFLLVESYYDRWANGEVGIRHEVSRKSRNTAYIFALIQKIGR